MDELEQLTSILGGTEKKRLDRLEQRLNDAYQRSQEIAIILPAALRALPDQTEFIAALQPSIDVCAERSVQQEPCIFVKAISPVIMPIIRQVTVETIKPITVSLQAQQNRLINLEELVNSLDTYRY